MQRSGFEVQSASDGEQALEMLAADRPDLMILDVMMPRKNGFEVCSEVRANPGLATLPILMLSAKGREAEIKKGLALGADAYITKPFSTHELVHQVSQLLERDTVVEPVR